MFAEDGLPFSQAPGATGTPRGFEFYDTATEASTRDRTDSQDRPASRSPRGRTPRSLSKSLIGPSTPRGHSASRREQTPRPSSSTRLIGQAESGEMAAMKQDAGNVSIGSSDIASLTSLGLTPHHAPQKQEQRGRETTTRNNSRTPPRIHRVPTPTSRVQSPERGASSRGLSPRRRIDGTFPPDPPQPSWLDEIPRDRRKPTQSSRQSDGTGKPVSQSPARAPSQQSSRGGRSSQGGRSFNGRSHLSNRSGQMCLDRTPDCADWIEFMCPGNRGRKDARGNPIPCQRATCRNCAIDCSLARCNAVHLCEECVPSANHKCGRVALLQMKAEMKEQNAISTKKELE